MPNYACIAPQPDRCAIITRSPTFADRDGAYITRWEERFDASKEPTKGTKVTPVLDPPKVAKPSTRSAALILDGPMSMEIDASPEVNGICWLDSTYWAEGIDYERWSAVVRPSPRAAFADRLDIVDILAD
jgi:hypothetical protein